MSCAISVVETKYSETSWESIVAFRARFDNIEPNSAILAPGSQAGAKDRKIAAASGLHSPPP